MMCNATLVAWVLLAGCGRIAFDPHDDASGTGSDGPLSARCGSEPSLVACYSFDGNSDDSSGSGNHATGALSFEPGRLGQGGTFGAGVDVRVPNSSSLAVVHVTLMAWIRLDSLPTDLRGVIFDHNLGYALSVRPDGGVGFALTTTTMATLDVNDPGVLALGAWTHIAVTYDGAELDLYIDGAVVDTATATGGLTNGDASGNRIGGNLADMFSSSEEVFVGSIDELGVWNTALPPARIAGAAAL